MRVTVRITGVPEVQRALESLPDQVRSQEIERVLTAAAEPIAAAARARAPVRTGRLRDSIVVGPEAKHARVRVGAGGTSVSVGSTSSKAHFQEYGTAHHAAQPFMRPAYDSEADNVRRDIEQGLLGIVQKAVRRRSA